MPSGAAMLDPVTGAYYDPITGQFLDDGSGSSALWGDDGEAGGAVSDAENQANLNAAAVQAAADLPSDRGQWSGHDASQYIRNFQAIILGNPGAFSPLTLQMAQNMNLARVDDEAGADPNKLINPARIIVAITDSLNDAVNTLTPISQFPQSLLGAANGIAAAANNLGKGLQNTGAISGLLQIALPVGLIIWALGAAAPSINSTKSIFR